MSKLISGRWLWLSLLVAALAGRLLLTNHHFYTHDDMQVFRVNEYVECIKDGQFPCRWSANLGKGYGYPLFNFYPPMIYLVPSLLHLLGLPIVTSLNLLMFASFLPAGWGMYLLGRALTQDSRLGFLSSLLYSLYPFHAVNVFVRGVYAENLTWSLLPLIFYLILEQSRHRRTSRILPALFAVVYLTHLIGAVIASGLVIIWALIHANLRRVIWQMALGLGMAAFFLLPAIIEKPLVQTESMITGYFAFTNHYVSSHQLFTQYRWSYDASLWSAAPDEMPYMVGHVHTALLLILLILLGWHYLRHPSQFFRPPSRLTLSAILLFISLGLLFLSHFKADFIWQAIPPLAYVQFPWRFIAWAAAPLTLSLALLVSLLSRRQLALLLPLLTLALLIYSFPFFRPREYDGLTDQDIIFGQERSLQQVKSLYDYLPHTVVTLPVDYASYPPSSWRSSHQYRDTVTLPVPSLVTFPVFYYPGWVAKINGISVAIPPVPDSGLITLSLPAGTSQVELDFHNTSLRFLANLISLTSLVLFLLYVILNSYGQTRSTK